ncbi:hypothetical protein [Gemmatimonas sp.]|uniref:hypothetical protein n=1 Tax=Gemmatimonas sp. TaxID=1962908 RepID=UPI003566CD86
MRSELRHESAAADEVDPTRELFVQHGHRVGSAADDRDRALAENHESGHPEQNELPIRSVAFD